MTTAELTAAVLAARGSVADEPQRSQWAAAVAYAAVDTEMSREGGRYTLHRGSIVSSSWLCRILPIPMPPQRRRAPNIPRSLVVAPTPWPRPTPADARAGHGGVTVGESAGGRSPCRASASCAWPQRHHRGPCSPAAWRSIPAAWQRDALKLGLGSLLGPQQLTVDAIRQRIASRYPAAEPIPEPPLLDDLLREAGIELVWDGDGADGRGCYRSRYLLHEPSSTATTLPRYSTALQPGRSPSPDVDAARALEERLAAALTDHRFLVLTVAQRYLLRAEDELVRRFAVTRMSLESMLLQEMKATAAAVGARWEVVLQADAATPEP